MTKELPQNWYKKSVFYQIYPRSFFLKDFPQREKLLSECQRVSNYKANDLESGNLAGITEKLNYLTYLGVDAIWICPFYKSPMADFGYDVMDYTDVDPVFGTLDDFKTLLNQATAKNLKVIIDFVPNHSSSLHPWFVNSRSSLNNPYRDFYFWRDPKNRTFPNNWKCSIEIGPAWTFDETTKQYYLHLFLPEQPDLNWYNPEVVKNMLKYVEFWLDLGVSGFRLDAVHCMGKDKDLSDSPPQWEWAPRAMFNNDPSVHPLLKNFRNFKTTEYDYVLIGEVFLPTVEAISKYYGDSDELDLCFIFPLALSGWSFSSWQQVLNDVYDYIISNNHWPAWTLSNHDLPRYLSRVGSQERARAAAVALLSLQGTPFIYQGEELGLPNALITEQDKIDPGGRDASRAPIPWEPNPPFGWPIKKPWLPFNKEAPTHNVQTEMSSSDSMLNFYKELLRLRKSTPLLHSAPMNMLDLKKPLLGWERNFNSDQLVVIINFSSNEIDLPKPYINYKVIFSSKDALTDRYTTAIYPNEAIILKSS
jgi:alpha-glucosidase